MSTVVNLAGLGSAGFIIQGDNPGDQAGFSISGAGDLNGDGFDDIVVGAPYNDAGGTDVGEAYVIYGHAGGFASIDLTNLSAGNGFRIQGPTPASFNTFDTVGLGVSSAGDINGDGFDDIVIGSDRRGAFGYGGAAQAYVIFGGPTRSATLNLTNLSTSDGFQIRAPFDSNTYYRAHAISVSSGGDMNGDGFDDLIVGDVYGASGSGTTYVVFGRSSGFGTNGVIDLAALSATDGFSIVGHPVSYAGFSASNVGDVNGDGFDDIVVGAPLGDLGGTDAGQAYVIFGHPGSFGTIQLANLANAPGTGFIIQGDATNDLAGWSVSSAGDINGDGLNDIVIGAPTGDSGAINAGVAYVIFGRTSGFGTIDLTNLSANVGFAIQSTNVGEDVGRSVSSAGDVNHDGFDDIIIGAPGNDAGGTDAGASYVIYGHAGGFATISLTNLSPSAGFVIQGATGGDLAGSVVSAAGDINGDGADDLLVSTPFGDLGGTNAGQAYVVFGTNTGGARDVHDDFNGNGRSDILWRNDDGTLTDWLSNGASGFSASSTFSTFVPTSWHVAGTADFTGDGRDDILWREDSGDITDWIANGSGGFRASTTFFTNVSTAWHVVGTGDFNGDDRSDILWRNDDGTITDWLSNSNGTFSASTTFSTFVATSWHVAGTGDFNGDGRDDILWRNDNGQLTDWLRTSNGGFVSNVFSVNVPTDWTVVATGDFNGDGYADVLWRQDTGQLTDWLGSATGALVDNSAHASNLVPTSWQVVNVGDFNGDARDDILWRNSSGQLTEWLATASGGFTDNSANASTFVSTAWHVVSHDGFLH